MPQDTRPLQSGAASILYGLSSLYSLELSRRHKSRCVAVSRLCSGAGEEGPALQAVHAEVGGGREGRVCEGVAALGPPLVQVRVKPEAELPAARSDHQVLTRPLRHHKLSIRPHQTHTNNIYLYEVISARTIREYCLLRSVERIPFYLVRTLMNN